jgi:hypothetical protein
MSGADVWDVIEHDGNIHCSDFVGLRPAYEACVKSDIKFMEWCGIGLLFQKF